MPRKTTPKYRLHKARNCAVVTINGRDHYLGAYDSPESREKFHRLVAEHLADRREPPPPVPADTPLTVTELIARYWRFAKGYYVEDGKPTSETHAIKLALRFVRRLYGNTAACEFSPKKLKAVREAMVAHEITRDVKVIDEATGKLTTVRKVIRKGLARKCINKLVGRVKRVYAWAVEEELVPVAVHAALARVKGLKKGKSAARETPRVRPVPDDHVQKLLAVVTPAVRGMVEVQRLAGAGRPHATVRHTPGRREWARDDDGDGVREVHDNTLGGLWAGLRTFLRPFRGVGKRAAVKFGLGRYLYRLPAQWCDSVAVFAVTRLTESPR